MALRKIIMHPDPRLKKACEPVSAVDDEIRTLMQDMLDTMYDAPGIGLAAPQVGVMKRIIVMDVVTEEDTASTIYMMVNPELIWASDEMATYEEGCLSIPDEFADVQRPARVQVRYTDETGTAQELDCDGLLATCVQHEIDHLNGKLFIDYLGPVKRSMITGRMKKRKKEWAAA